MVDRRGSDELPGTRVERVTMDNYRMFGTAVWQCIGIFDSKKADVLMKKKLKAELTHRLYHEIEQAVLKARWVTLSTHDGYDGERERREAFDSILKVIEAKSEEATSMMYFRTEYFPD
jgi:hypothetical protein